MSVRQVWVTVRTTLIRRAVGQLGLYFNGDGHLGMNKPIQTSFGATRLKMDLDRIPLWRGDSVEVKQLVEGDLRGDGGPKNVRINVEIGMDQTIAHADDGPPGDLGVGVAGLRRDLARRLSDDLDRAHQRE